MSKKKEKQEREKEPLENLRGKVCRLMKLVVKRCDFKAKGAIKACIAWLIYRIKNYAGWHNLVEKEADKGTIPKSKYYVLQFLYKGC